MTPTKIDLAWAGGLFEGEGTICTTWSGKYLHQRAKLNMIDRDVVERFHDVIGVGWVVKVLPRKKHHKMQWQWGTGSKREVREVVKKLKPYLGKRRLAQIAEVEKTISKYERGCNA